MKGEKREARIRGESWKDRNKDRVKEGERGRARGQTGSYHKEVKS